jgi:hypothetical protein
MAWCFLFDLGRRQPGRRARNLHETRETLGSDDRFEIARSVDRDRCICKRRNVADPEALTQKRKGAAHGCAAPARCIRPQPLVDGHSDQHRVFSG